MIEDYHNQISIAWCQMKNELLVSISMSLPTILDNFSVERMTPMAFSLAHFDNQQTRKLDLYAQFLCAH